MTKGYKRAFDTSYEAHLGLIKMMARKGYMRLVNAHVCIDYEDVFQEMSLTYVHASQKYDAEKGVSFSAYLGQAIWNRFNIFAEKQIGYKTNLNLCSFQELSEASDYEGETDISETIDSGEASPELIAETKQQMKVTNGLLSKVSKLIVKQFIDPSDDMLRYIAERRNDVPLSDDATDNALARACNKVTFKAIVDFHKVDRLAAKKARKQINKIFNARI